jgi:hemolysin III
MHESDAPSMGEEIANSVSHGVGLLAAVAAIPVLVQSAAAEGGAARIVGAAVYGATLVLLYLASTVYHAWPGDRGKRILRILDHGAIYLLIAGTYTPFTLGALAGPWGWTLFGVVWGLALLGIVLKSVRGIEFPVLSTGIYVAMGWLVLVAIRPLLASVPVQGVLWLLAGGLAYTAGIGFYAARRLRYAHFVWHLFVVAGSACHFVAVLRYAA